MIEIVSWVAGSVAVYGAYLNNRKSRICFALWMASNAASGGLHIWAGMWGLAARDAVFLVLAVQGWILWGKKKCERENVRTGRSGQLTVDS